MKWLLVMLVHGSPIKTDLYFPTLRECLQAEDLVAKQYTDAYSETVDWAKQSKPSDQFAGIEKLALSRLHRGTCIPASK